MKTGDVHLKEINRLLSIYIQEIRQSDLKPLSAQVYEVQSKNFVRWINGEFNPGTTIKTKKLSEKEKN